MNDTLHPRVREYLRRFDAEAQGIPAGRRLSLREEIEAHLRDVIATDSTDAAATAAISEFGSPAEIIGQELDNPTRLTPGSRRRRWRRPLAIVGVLAAVALVIPLGIALVGKITAGSNPGPPSVVNEAPEGLPRVTEGQAYFEYLAAIEEMEYPLPAGAEYPNGVPEGLDAGPVAGPPPGVMESGAGFHLAHFTWLCAWESDYLAAFEAKDFKRQVKAESMLNAWTETEWYSEWDPARSWVTVVINPMKVGDPSGLKRDRTDTCAQAGIFNVRS